MISTLAMCHSDKITSSLFPSHWRNVLSGFANRGVRIITSHHIIDLKQNIIPMSGRDEEQFGHDENISLYSWFLSSWNETFHNMKSFKRFPNKAQVIWGMTLKKLEINSKEELFFVIPPKSRCKFGWQLHPQVILQFVNKTSGLGPGGEGRPGT